MALAARTMLLASGLRGGESCERGHATCWHLPSLATMLYGGRLERGFHAGSSVGEGSDSYTRPLARALRNNIVPRTLRYYSTNTHSTHRQAHAAAVQVCSTPARAPGHGPAPGPRLAAPRALTPCAYRSTTGRPGARGSAASGCRACKRLPNREWPCAVRRGRCALRRRRWTFA